MKAHSEFMLRMDATGLVQCSFRDQPLYLSLDSAYELQYSLAAFLAEMELQEMTGDVSEAPEYQETKQVLQHLAAHSIRKFDA